MNKLIALVVSAGTKMCLENHVYQIDGTVRRQAEGGAIGSDLSGENPPLYMLSWDCKFRKRLRKLGILIAFYTRYVDDTVCLLQSIQKGWTYSPDKDKIIFTKELANTDTQKNVCCILNMRHTYRQN